MAVSDAYVFPGCLTPVLTQLFFPKPPTTFLTCFCRGERRKYAKKKSCLNRGSNSQPPGLKSDMLTTEPPRRGDRVYRLTHYHTIQTFNDPVGKALRKHYGKRRNCWQPAFFLCPYFLTFPKHISPFQLHYFVVCKCSEFGPI
jgi:hypothetical protein